MTSIVNNNALSYRYNKSKVIKSMFTVPLKHISSRYLYILFEVTRSQWPFHIYVVDILKLRHITKCLGKFENVFKYTWAHWKTSWAHWKTSWAIFQRAWVFKQPTTYVSLNYVPNCSTKTLALSSINLNI